ncbi:MAG: hypothetical protein Q9192_007568, partial [Flavoplaca navasiana]
DLDDETLQLADPSQPSPDAGSVSRRHEESNCGLSNSSDNSNHGLETQSAGANVLHGSQKTQSQRSATTPDTTPSPIGRQPSGVPSRHKLAKERDHQNKQLITKWRQDYNAQSTPLDPTKATKIIADTRTSIVDLYLREHRTTSRAMNVLGEQATRDPLMMNLLNKSAREKDDRLEKVFQVYLKYAKQEIKNPGSRQRWFPKTGGRSDGDEDHESRTEMPPKKKRRAARIVDAVIKVEDEDGTSSSPYNLRMQTPRLLPLLFIPLHPELRLPRPTLTPYQISQPKIVALDLTSFIMMPFTSGIFNADGVQPSPSTAADIADAHNTLIKLIKGQYAAGTLNLEQINSYLFPFLKLDFLPANWKPGNEPTGFSVPKIPTAIVIYPLDGNPLPMEVKEALVNSMSPEEAEEFAQMIHIKQEEGSVSMDADLAEGPTTPQPSRSLSPVSSSTASSWVHIREHGETNIEPHSSNACIQDPPSSPPTLALDDYGQEVDILMETATQYDKRTQRTCNEPQAHHDTESASSSTTFAESLYGQPPNSPTRDTPWSPSTWGSAAGEMDVDSLASDHDEDEEEDEDDLAALCSPRDLACRVRAIVYPAIQQYKKNNDAKLAKTLDALFMQGISHNFVLHFLDAICSEKATVQQYTNIKTCLHFHYAKMRMDEVWKRATYRRSTFTLEEPEIQRTKFGLTQLKQ